MLIITKLNEEILISHCKELHQGLILDKLIENLINKDQAHSEKHEQVFSKLDKGLCETFLQLPTQLEKEILLKFTVSQMQSIQ